MAKEGKGGSYQSATETDRMTRNQGEDDEVRRVVGGCWRGGGGGEKALEKGNRVKTMGVPRRRGTNGGVVG